MLAHFGKRDESVKEAGVNDLAQRIWAAGGSIEAYFYEAGHAFFNDTRRRRTTEPARSWR